MRQGGRPGQVQGERGGMNQREAMQDLKKLERLRMMKLLDLLDLDNDVESKLIPHIRNHHREMFQIMRKYQSKIDQLAKGLRKDNLSEEEIIERIKEIDQLDTARHEKIRDFHIEASKILTAEQLGKLYVFQARFGGEVLEKMRDFKKAQDERRRRENGN